MARNAESGLTLVEIVMVIVIVGILAGGSMLYIRQIIELWDFTSFRSEIVAQGRVALGRMSRDIRQIRNSTSVFYANGTRLQFNDTDNVSINYYLSNNINLMRNNDILAEGVSSLVFSYYNQTNQIIANPLVRPQETDIRRINIKLNIFSGDQNKTLETQIYPRNIGG